MPTIATLRPTATTDATQVFVCRGARNLYINISRAGVMLSFAYEEQGVLGGFGPEEYHAAEILSIDSEPIGAVAYRSAVAGSPGTIIITATT